MATFRRFLLPGLLLVALVGSNLWWLYQAIDLGVTQKYADQLRYERTHALGALQRTVPALTRDLSKEEVVERIRAELEVAPDSTLVTFARILLLHPNCCHTQLPGSRCRPDQEPAAPQRHSMRPPGISTN